MRKIIVLVALLTQTTLLYGQPTPPQPITLADYNFVVGTQMIGGKYKFTDDSYLVEQAKQIRGMGSNILKVSLGQNYPKTYPDLKPASGIRSTVDIVKTQKDFREIFSMDFKYIFLWVHTLTGIRWQEPMTPDEKAVIYKEMYDLASYLLTEYSGTGKTFMIGNWEGDWLLHGVGNRDKDPGDEKIRAMKEWFVLRQTAIDDAKRKVAHKDVNLFYYVEVNLAEKGMRGERCITESILEEVNPDLVSYSSYEAIKKHANYASLKSHVGEVMNYIASKLTPKAGIPFDSRVFIGEYGYQVGEKNTEEMQFAQTKELMLVSLELNLPFALHWELYNNEYTADGVSKGMSLISEAGKFKSVYYLHKNYYEQINAYLLQYKSKHGDYPGNDAFRKQAIATLQALEY